MAAGSPEDQMETLEVEVADSHGHTAEALESSLKDVNNSSVSESMYSIYSFTKYVLLQFLKFRLS